MNPSDPIGRPGKTGALFARLFSRVFTKKDTISLLRALIEFSSLKKTLIVYDGNDEYEFILPRLECFPSKKQVKAKCTDLKRLYMSNLSKGVAAGGMTGDDAVIFELSEKLWGEEIIRPAKEKERERSARAVNLDDLIAGLKEGKSSGMVSGTGGKRKREDEPGKIGGMARNDEDGKFAGSAVLSAEPGSEDGELARKVPRKKDKKHKREDDSAKRQRSRENGSGGEMSDKERSKLAKAEDSRAKSGLEDEGSTSYELKNKKKNKREDEPGKIGGMAGNDEDGEFAGSAELSVEPGSEDGESSRKVPTKKEKKHKGENDSAKRHRSLENGSSGEMSNKESSKLAKAEDSRANSASFELMNKKKHKRVKRSRELENLPEKGSGNEDDVLARSVEWSADSQLDKGKSPRRKKKHKGDKAGDFKRLSESGSADEVLNDIGKSVKSTKSRAKSGSERCKSLREMKNL